MRAQIQCNRGGNYKGDSLIKQFIIFYFMAKAAKIKVGFIRKLNAKQMKNKQKGQN